jgi:hypothetical protein
MNNPMLLDRWVLNRNYEPTLLEASSQETFEDSDVRGCAVASQGMWYPAASQGM